MTGNAHQMGCNHHLFLFGIMKQVIAFANSHTMLHNMESSDMNGTEEQVCNFGVLHLNLKMVDMMTTNIYCVHTSCRRQMQKKIL